MRRLGKDSVIAGAFRAGRAKSAIALVCGIVLLAGVCAFALGHAQTRTAFAEDENPAPSSSTTVPYQQGVASDASSNAQKDASPGSTPSNDVNKPETPQSSVDTSVPVVDLQGNVVNGAQLPDSSFLYDTSIAALTSADSYYDGQIVQVIGEAIGDAVRPSFDNDHVWITLESTEAGDSGSIAVFMSNDLRNLIDGFGRYGVTGTTLQVRGVFHLACIEHDGITDLHAETASVVKNSETHPDVFNMASFIPGALLLVVGIAAAVLFHILRERRR